MRPSVTRARAFTATNVSGTARVLQACRDHDVQTLVFTASSSVYGELGRAGPCAEDTPLPTPRSPYAASKRAAELLCRSVAAEYGLRVAIARLFTVYGPGQRPDLAIARFLRLGAAGQPLPLYGDGSSARDYTYVGDAVAGLLACARVAGARSPGSLTVNLAGGRPVTLTELVDRIGEVLGSEPRRRHHGRQPGDVERTHACLERARAILGYEPDIALADGLRRQWQATQVDGSVSVP